MRKYTPPAITLKSFNCPRCGALAHQTWYALAGKRITREGKEDTPNLTNAEWVEQLKADNENRRETKIPADVITYFEKCATRDTFLYELPESEYYDNSLVNLHASKCYSCKAISLWHYDSILYPEERFPVEPNEDLQDGIKADFEEARAILNLSPRGAAALLRLCIQKLCMQLGKPGKNINEDIASLVADGLDPLIQHSLDIVRIAGNSAVHPAEMDLRDDRETAAKLFDLVNLIAYDRLTRPREVAALFSNLPPDKVAAIGKRDGKIT